MTAFIWSHPALHVPIILTTQFTQRNSVTVDNPSLNVLLLTTQLTPNLCPWNSATWVFSSTSHTRTAGWWPHCKHQSAHTGITWYFNGSPGGSAHSHGPAPLCGRLSPSVGVCHRWHRCVGVCHRRVGVCHRCVGVCHRLMGAGCSTGSHGPASLCGCLSQLCGCLSPLCGCLSPLCRCPSPLCGCPSPLCGCLSPLCGCHPCVDAGGSTGSQGPALPRGCWEQHWLSRASTPVWVSITAVWVSVTAVWVLGPALAVMDQHNCAGVCHRCVLGPALAVKSQHKIQSCTKYDSFRTLIKYQWYLQIRLHANKACKNYDLIQKMLSDMSSLQNMHFPVYEFKNRYFGESEVTRTSSLRGPSGGGAANAEIGVPSDENPELFPCCVWHNIHKTDDDEFHASPIVNFAPFFFFSFSFSLFLSSLPPDQSACLI